MRCVALLKATAACAVEQVTTHVDIANHKPVGPSGHSKAVARSASHTYAGIPKGLEWLGKSVQTRRKTNADLKVAC